MEACLARKLFHTLIPSSETDLRSKPSTSGKLAGQPSRWETFRFAMSVASAPAWQPPPKAHPLLLPQPAAFHYPVIPEPGEANAQACVLDKPSSLSFGKESRCFVRHFGDMAVDGTSLREAEHKFQLSGFPCSEASRRKMRKDSCFPLPNDQKKSVQQLRE